MALIDRSGFLRQNACNWRLKRDEISIAGTGNMVAGRDVLSMRVNRIIAARWVLASLLGLLGLAGFGPGESRAAEEVRPPVAIQFSLDRPIDAGAAAPFVMATGGRFSSAARLSP